MRKLVFILLLVLLAPCIAFARGDEALELLNKLNQRLERAHETIEDVEKKLADPNLTDTALRGLRGRLDPLPKEFDETIEILTPRLTAIQERLKELQPPETKPAEKPADKAAEPEKPAETKNVPVPPQRPADRTEKPATGKSADSGKPGVAKPADAVKSQAPTAPEPPAAESPEDGVRAEIAEQRQLFDGTDATLKRARALQLETRQLIVSIVARQRELFAKTLFLRTDGLFSPSLWRVAFNDAPAALSGVASFLPDRLANFAGRIGAGNPLHFFGIILAIILAIPPAFIMSRRVARRNDSEAAPSRLRKAASAAWTILVVAAVPVAAIATLGATFESFDLIDATLEPIWLRIVEAVARVAVTYAIARGLLAPSHPQWRIVDPGDRLSRLLVRLTTFAALALAAARLVEQLEETVQASLSIVVVTRGLGVMIVTALLAYAVASLPRTKDGDTNGDVVATAAGRDWVAAARFFGVAAIVVLLSACAAGYITLANFIIREAGWIAAVAAVVYIIVMLANGAVEAALSPAHFVGRHLISDLGVKREQLAPMAVLFTGVITLLGYIAAFLLALAPLGFESGDFLANVAHAFISFKVGEVTLSPSALIGAIGIFALVLALAQGLRRWLDTRFLPLTRLDLGLRNSISSTLGYVGFLSAAALSLSHLGLGFEKLAIVAGALSVGIGFGLQSIVGNFVSGLILLWERAIRVGDWVVVGDEQGYVKRINVRSTEIETFDRATMIVPNQNLITGVVKNWLRGDKVGRIKVALTPKASADPEHIRDIMLAAARAQEGVLRIPAPQVMFLAMDSSGFKFELWCYVEDVEKSSRVRSDLYFELHRRLVEAGVSFAEASAATPTTIVQFPNLDKVAAAAAASALAIEAGVFGAQEEEPAKPAEQTEPVEAERRQSVDAEA